jgi:hypothetical protein
MHKLGTLIWAFFIFISANYLWASANQHALGFSLYEFSQNENLPITPFDEQKAYQVAWDTIMSLPDTIEHERFYSGNEKFGNHLLPAHSLRAIPISYTQNPFFDLVTFVILFCMMVLSLANYFFPLKLRETIMAVWNSRHYSQIEKEGGLMNDWVSFFLFLNYLLVMILLSYQVITFYEIKFHNLSLLLFIAYLLAGLILFYVLKYIVLFFLAWVFKTRGSTEAYFRNILIINNFTGIVILPILIVNAFNPTSYLIYVALIFLIVINLYKVIRGSLLGFQKVEFPAYYLILYLCAIEIAPILLLIKISGVYLSG